VSEALPTASSKPSNTFQEAQAAFDQRQYARALGLLDRLTKEESSTPGPLRLKIKTFIRLERPADALREYERLEGKLGKDDELLLREVAVGFITPVLKDMREQMRGAAYTALKEINSNEAIPHLEDGLSDGSGLVRTLAAEGLARLKAGQRSARLRKAMMEDQAAMVRAAALKGLGRSGDRSAIPLAEKLLADEQPTVRVAAAGALVMLGRAETWNRISQAAGAPNPEERGAALRMLGDLRDRRALPILLQTLTDAQPSVRGAAATALGELGDAALPDAAPALINALNDPIPAVRASAAVSLGEEGATDSIPALKKMLDDANPAVRAASLAALLRLGTPYSECAGAIRDLTGMTDPGIRAAAAKAMGNGRGNEIVDVLQLLLGDPLPRPRIAAARSLGQIGGRDALSILKKALKDQDAAVRATVGGALGRILFTTHQTATN
jgi:HEAT repeat protein